MRKDWNVLKKSRLTHYAVLPEKVLLTGGKVLDAGLLTEEKIPSVTTNEPRVTVLTNAGGGENAFVLLDFGTELAGGARILTHTVGGAATPEVRLVFGESVSEAMSRIGEKNATNDHSIRDMVVKLTNFSDMIFGQSGFRFLKIELITPGASVRLKSVLADATLLDLPYRGSFVCSDPLLNRIYDTAAYTCHLNMQDCLWDGIKRDRLVWLGDSHPETMTIRTVFGYDPIVEESIDAVIRQFPLPRYPNDMITYAFWMLLIARDWCFAAGKNGLILSHADYFRGMLRSIAGEVNEDGTDRLSNDRARGWFLDWPTSGREDSHAGTHALLAGALHAGEWIAEVLGDDDLKALCADRAEKLDRNPMPITGNKSAAAIAVWTGEMTPEKGAEILLSGGMTGFSTFLSYYQLSAIARAGRLTEALDVLRKYYGGMLAVGATTFFEDFDLSWVKDGARIDTLPDGYDIHGDNGGYCYVGLRHSLCHGWSSGPTAFLCEQVLGITVEAPGCRKLRVCPHLGDLAWAKGTFPTPYGDVKVEVTPDKLTVDAPDGVEIIM